MPRYQKLEGTPAQIVMRCQSRQHTPHDFKKPDADIVRGRQLSRLFEGRDAITADEAPALFKSVMGTDFSLEFEAKRAGECLFWGTEHGVISRVTGPRRGNMGDHGSGAAAPLRALWFGQEPAQSPDPAVVIAGGREEGS